MVRKGEPVLQPTSLAGCADGRAEDGFTLLEIVCILAILAIVASIAGPLLPHSTSRARLESYAVATAAVLRADRSAAIRRGAQVATLINAPSRLVRSGATGREVRVPNDVTFDALLSARCDRQSSSPTIRFFPSGMSCGGIIALTRSGNGYEIRVNWLTGGIDIATRNRS